LIRVAFIVALLLRGLTCVPLLVLARSIVTFARYYACSALLEQHSPWIAASGGY